MEYILLIWIGEFLYFEDTYINRHACTTNAELILSKQHQYSYICAPHTRENRMRNVKGVFNKNMLKKKK